MTRTRMIVVVVAILALGTSMGLAFDTGSHVATPNDGTMPQETTTTAVEETTVAESVNLTFTNQTSNGTVIVVERVVVPEGGFMVIYAAENASRDEADENETEVEGGTQTETTLMDGENRWTEQYVPAEVLGNSTYLEPGVHENVTVMLNETLDVRLNEQKVLIAMPYQDTNDNQQYDFPEADDPYTQDGQPVTDAAFITLEETANQTTTPADTETTTDAE